MAAAPKGVRERIEKGADKTPVPSIRFSTGSLLLDLVSGGGRGSFGLKGGTLVRFVAVNSGGKSSMATEMLAHNKRRPPHPDFWEEYLDREYRFAFDTKETYGVELNVLGADGCPRTVEELSAHLGTKLKAAKGPGIVAIDSLEAFSTEETEDRQDTREDLYSKDKDIELDGSYTAKTGAASVMSETLRITLAEAARTGTLLLALSQIRVNLDGGKFAPKVRKVGGAALDHWVDTEIWLKPLHYIEVGNKEDQTNRTIGFVGLATEEKGTKDRPYRSCVYTFLYGYGLDDIGDQIDFLFNLRNPKTGKFWNDKRSGDVANNVCPIVCNWKPGSEKTVETVKEWLQGLGLLDACVEAKREETGRGNLSLAYLDEWVSRHPEIEDKYTEAFPCYTRDQLIRAVEDSPEMRQELRERVIQKWEAIETQAATQVTERRRKWE